MMISATGEVVDKIKRAYQEIQIASNEIKEIEANLLEIERQREEGNKLFEASRTAQIEAYVKRQLPLELYREYFELEIRMPEERLAMAEANYEARKYVLANLGEFTKGSDQQEYLALVSEWQILHDKVQERRIALLESRSHMNDLWEEYGKAAGSSLSYWDFLYFSIGAATTVTFGDIVPNHKSVRLLVCLQVLGNIILLSLVINELAAQHSGT